MQRLALLLGFLFSVNLFALPPLTNLPWGNFFGDGRVYNNEGGEDFYFAHAVVYQNKLHIAYYDNGLLRDWEYFFTFTEQGMFDLTLVVHEGGAVGVYETSGFCDEKKCFYSFEQGGVFWEEIIEFDLINKKIEKDGRKIEGQLVAVWEDTLEFSQVSGVCGDGIIQDHYEQCDDGNNLDGDGCDRLCRNEFCGDGIVNNNGEECDDGNSASGDGCSDLCTIEIIPINSSREIFDVGHQHVCVRDQISSQVKCFGYNNEGQLGQENTAEVGDGVGPSLSAISFINLGTSKTAQMVAAGGDQVSESTCILLNDGSVKCFGDNGSGQLGQENSTDLGDNIGEMGDNLIPVNLGTGLLAKDIASGGWHQCVILNDDSVKCWGTNIDGELGYEDTVIRGFGPGTMGDNLPVVNLGTGRTAKKIYAGEDPTCAILDNDDVKCWGRNFNGAGGQGTTSNIGDAAGEMGDNLNAIDLGSGRYATELGVGASHVCALLDNGTVKCWGWNPNGNLGQGHANNIGDNANEMGDNLLSIDLGTGRTAVQIASGRIHNCALLDNGAVKCWGNNSAGQLGLGDTNHRGDSAGEMGDNLPEIDLGTGRTAIAIAAGGNTTCVKLDNSDIKCFGNNNFGQLAQNSVDNKGDAPGEMGDNLPAIVTGF